MHLASMIWYFDTSISHMKVRAIRSALVGFRSPLNHIRNGVICPRGDVPGIGFLRHKSTLDITTTNEASLSRATSEGQKTAWHLGGALTRFDRRYDVFEVSKTGRLRRTSVTLAEVMADFGVHARDLLSLGLQDERYNPPPAVLPRDGVVVVALGPFKALVHTEACVVFEAGKGDVAHITPILAELMQANAKMPPTDGRRPGAGTTPAGRAGAGIRQMAGGQTEPSTSRVVRTAVIAHEHNMSEPSTVMGRDARESIVQKVEDVAISGESAGVTGRGSSAEVAASPSSGEEAGEPGEAQRVANGSGVREHPMMVMFSEQMPMPFELAMLEAMLQEVCASYQRRAQIVRRLMERGLKPSETSTLLAPNRLDYYRVVPLKLALKQIELKLSDTRACLEELMHSDEDMLGLLLTEAKGLRRGEILDHHRHSVVELLLENYHRQLVLVGHDVATMKQEIESVQEFAAMSLDVSRNSLIAVDIRLAMMNLFVASSGCFFGAMGMNVVNGLEESHLAFYAMLGSSTAFSALALTGVGRYLRSIARTGDSQQGELAALNAICDHVDDIESVIRTELDSPRAVDATGNDGDGSTGKIRPRSHEERPRGIVPRGTIDRDVMARKLSRARGKDVSKHELDLIFTVFDTTGDGSIDRDEFGRIVSEAAGAPRSGARR